jgi:hypothetical protein
VGFLDALGIFGVLVGVVGFYLFLALLIWIAATKG